MDYKILKLKFKTAVHFGNGNLFDSGYVYRADSLFSALCIEAVKLWGESGINKLTDYVRQDKLKFSDALPYIDDTLYLPKPIRKITVDKQGDSRQKKAYKKLKYIPADKFYLYLKGDLQPEEETDSLKKLGKGYLSMKASVAYEEQTEPYPVGQYSFSARSGLYVVLAYEGEDILYFISELFAALSYTGIGGKVSSGLGKFTVSAVKIPRDYLKALKAEDCNAYMSLSIGLPGEEELEDVMRDSCYSLVKRSGFVQSVDSSVPLYKKKDFYAFAAGSCFSRKFSGDIFDVSQRDNHAVYRYAKPLFIGVK